MTDNLLEDEGLYEKAKNTFSSWFESDPESEKTLEQPVAGTELSRRGALTAIGTTALAGYGLAQVGSQENPEIASTNETQTTDTYQTLQGTNITQEQKDYLGLETEEADMVYSSSAGSQLPTHEQIIEGNTTQEHESTKEAVTDLDNWYDQNLGGNSNNSANTTLASGTSQYNESGYNTTTNQTTENELDIGFEDVINTFSTTVDEGVSNQFIDAFTNNESETFKTAYAAVEAEERYSDAGFLKNIFSENPEITSTEIQFLGLELGKNQEAPSDPYSDDWSGDGVTNEAAIELYNDPLQTQELFSKDEKHIELDIGEDGNLLHQRETWMPPKEDEELTEEDKDTITNEIEAENVDTYLEIHNMISEEHGKEQESGPTYQDVDINRNQALRSLNRTALDHLDSNAQYNQEEITPTESLTQITESALGTSSDSERLLRNTGMISNFTDPYIQAEKNGEEDAQKTSLDFLEIAEISETNNFTTNKTDLVGVSTPSKIQGTYNLKNIENSIRENKGPIKEPDGDIEEAYTVIRNNQVASTSSTSNGGGGGGSPPPGNGGDDGGDAH